MRSIVVLFLFLFSGTAFAAGSIIDVPYSFDAEGLANAENPYSFMTAFAGYYYRLMDANRVRLSSVHSLRMYTGWCAGDAHPENFGALILRDGSNTFTINDMDDAGPCPVAMDLLRFFVTAVLAEPKVDVNDLIGAYAAGLKGDRLVPPKDVTSLLKESESRGMAVKPADVDIKQKELIRDSQARELTASEWAEIRAKLESITTGMNLIDAFATAKEGGGSSGVLRFELLFDGNWGLMHLELKGQPDPALSPVATAPIPACADRIQETVSREQGAMASPYYQVVEILKRPMLLRPRYYGNTGAKIKVKAFTNNLPTLVYEAYTLGLIHAQSVANPQQLAADMVARLDWSEDVALLASHFQNKYSELSANLPFYDRNFARSNFGR